MTVVGLHNFVKVSISAFKCFLLIMCINAPKSTTNSRSSGERVDGGHRRQFSEGENNAALFFSTLFHGHLALATLSPPESDPQILERWGCAEAPGQINPSEGFWSRMFA